MVENITVWQIDSRFPTLLTAEVVPVLQRSDVCVVTPELAEHYPTLERWDSPRKEDAEWTPGTAPQLPEGTRYLLTSLSKVDLPLTYPQLYPDVEEWEWNTITLPDGMSMVEAAQVMSEVRRQGPWESEQTHESLVPYLLEETYELVDAISDKASGTAEIVSELGDVFLEVLFHAAVGETSTGDQHFSYDDVADSLLGKLKRRMPYAFNGGRFPATAAEQDELWQASKNREDRSPLDGIVRSQPALSLAAQVVKRARRAGIKDAEIPAVLRRVADAAADGQGSAEEKLRVVALDFLTHVRGK